MSRGVDFKAANVARCRAEDRSKPCSNAAGRRAPLAARPRPFSLHTAVTARLHAIAVCVPIRGHRRLGRRQRRQVRGGNRGSRRLPHRAGSRGRSGGNRTCPCRDRWSRRMGLSRRRPVPVTRYGRTPRRGVRCFGTGTDIGTAGDAARRRQWRLARTPAGIRTRARFRRARGALRLARGVDAGLCPRLRIAQGVVDALGRGALAAQRIDRRPLAVCRRRQGEQRGAHAKRNLHWLSCSFDAGIDRLSASWCLSRERRNGRRSDEADTGGHRHCQDSGL